MHVLEELYISFLIHSQELDTIVRVTPEAAQDRLITSIGHCCNLKKLKLKEVKLAVSTDQALAACALGNPHLTRLEIELGTFIPKRFPFPALYEAMSDNFVIQDMVFMFSVVPLHSDRRVNWPGIDTVPRLNREGRKYMLEDKMDRSKGVDLLGRVSESLNCLYFHLRENPALVVASHEHIRIGGKRKRDASNVA